MKVFTKVHRCVITVAKVVSLYLISLNSDCTIAVLTKVDTPNSYNYKIRVNCKEGGQFVYVFMDSEKREAMCNTDTGTYSTTELTPCLKAIDPTD